MGCMTVCPDDLRFTQDSIKDRFRPPHDNLRIDDAVNQIRKNLLSADDFPALNVVYHGGILWSLDNRRLWAFRKAGVAVIEVNLVPVDYSPRSAEFFRNLEPSLERRYSSPAYYPPIRKEDSARDKAAAPTLAQDHVKYSSKFSETERQVSTDGSSGCHSKRTPGAPEANTILGAKSPPVHVAENGKDDMEGGVYVREACTESAGHTMEMVEIGIAAVAIGWGVSRMLRKFF